MLMKIDERSSYIEGRSNAIANFLVQLKNNDFVYTNDFIHQLCLCILVKSVLLKRLIRNKVITSALDTSKNCMRTQIPNLV